MDPVRAHVGGMPLGVEHPLGGRRVIAELYRHPRGLVFLDIGWPQASSHPAHLIEGQVPDEGPPWRVGEAEIFRISEADDLLEDWLAWRQLRKLELARFDRAAGARFARADGLLVFDGDPEAADA